MFFGRGFDLCFGLFDAHFLVFSRLNLFFDVFIAFLGTLVLFFLHFARSISPKCTISSVSRNKIKWLTIRQLFLPSSFPSSSQSF